VDRRRRAAGRHYPGSRPPGLDSQRTVLSLQVNPSLQNSNKSSKRHSERSPEGTKSRNPCILLAEQGRRGTGNRVKPLGRSKAMQSAQISYRKTGERRLTTLRSLYLNKSRKPHLFGSTPASYPFQNLYFVDNHSIFNILRVQHVRKYLKPEILSPRYQSPFSLGQGVGRMTFTAIAFGRDPAGSMVNSAAPCFPCVRITATSPE
jgi:hypothetical protein